MVQSVLRYTRPSSGLLGTIRFKVHMVGITWYNQVKGTHGLGWDYLVQSGLRYTWPSLEFLGTIRFKVHTALGGITWYNQV